MRQKRPDTRWPLLTVLWREATLTSLAIGLGFAIILGSIVLLRPQALSYRLGETIRHDKVSRVAFAFNDPEKVVAERTAARDNQPRVYAARGDVWSDLEQHLLTLPDRLSGLRRGDLKAEVAAFLDEPTLLAIQSNAQDDRRPNWDAWVRNYVAALRNNPPLVLPEAERAEDLERFVQLEGAGRIPASDTLSSAQVEKQVDLYNRYAEQAFDPVLYPKIARLTQQHVGVTHRLDANATTTAKNNAERAIGNDDGEVFYAPNQLLIPAGKINGRDLSKLAAEQQAFERSLGFWPAMGERFGLATVVVLLTGLLGVYIAQYQPRILHNHLRALGLSALFAGTVLVAQLAALSTQPLYLFATAPTLLVATILAIAYDRRFALGTGAVHAAFVTLATAGGLGLMLVLAAGVVTTALMLDEVRNRSKLIEVGGASGLVMAAAAIATGFAGLDDWHNVLTDAGYAFGAALGTGFLVLGVLPFIEKVFRITTSMTLLELADVNHPLLLRLQQEAPGSYNHSLQVAHLAEECARAVGANSLLCRVAGYFHDVGKIHKADYFIENQSGRENRHLNLSPSVSLLIIIGHVKDGVELAREYQLPRAIMPFIQEHHGTTLVEFFYKTAKDKQEQLDERDRSGDVSEDQYRYPGPKPRSRETAIMMLADAVESATRAMKEHNPSRIESRVHDLIMKRLLDGQFENCDLTMGELAVVEQTLVKTLLNMYHARIEYPSDREESDREEKDDARPEQPVVPDPATQVAAG